MSQRLDKWLVYARFVKHRARAQALVGDGHVRVNRQRVEKTSHVVKADDVLTLALDSGVRIVRVLGVAEARGPARLAQQLYEEVEPPQKQDADETAS